MNARASLATGLAIGCLLLAAACGPVKPAYSPEQAKECAAIEARWLEAVVAACYGAYALNDCPAVPSADATRLKEQEAAGCR